MKMFTQYTYIHTYMYIYIYDYMYIIYIYVYVSPPIVDVFYSTNRLVTISNIISIHN